MCSHLADPLFIATGAAGKLYLRSLTAGWQPVGPSAAYCLGGPAAVITGSTLTVACEGTSHALYYNTAAVVSSGLPQFTSRWISLGGTLTAGPAVAPVGTAVTFFAPGVGGRVYTRTASTGFTATPWTCIGQAAAALQAAAGSTTFACQGTNHAMWQSASSGAGWSAAVSLGGQLTGGPGIAASGQVEFFAEGSTRAVYARTAATGWASIGGTVTGGVGAAALNTPAGAPWGQAIAVPGLTALNTEDAVVNSLSCPSAGNCTVGGQYVDSAGHTQAFVAIEVNGTWNDAIPVPGLAALNTGGYAFINSVSCGLAGNCVAGGEYSLTSSSVNGNTQAFVAYEANNTWGDAIEVPGTAALNAGNGAQVMSVSCTPDGVGDCTVGGYYTDGFDIRQAFVANDVNGTWDDAIEVPGTAVLNAGGVLAEASVQSVSCSSTGNCAVGGSYVDSSGTLQAFVANDVNGTWDDAIEVPGTAALNTGGNAEVSSVSCSSAGNCVAGGGYSVSASSGLLPSQTFVASEVNGIWGDAIEVPGTAALNAGEVAFVNSVSCASAGNCAAGGYYDDSSGVRRAFVASETNGTWDEAIEVPGTGGTTLVNSVSCPSAGNCVAGGGYLGPFTTQAFVVSEVNGTWDEAIQIAGIPEASSSVESVSCPSVGGCAAGGFGPISGGPAFVVSQN